MIQVYLEADGWYPYGKPIREKLSDRAHYPASKERALDGEFPPCEAKRGRPCPRCPKCTRWRGVEWPDVSVAEDTPIVHMLDRIYAEVNSGDLRNASKQAREALIWQRLTDPPPYELACFIHRPKPTQSNNSSGLAKGVVRLFTSIWRSVFGD